MKWIKSLKDFGVAGGTAILTAVAVILAVIIAGVIQLLFRTIQPEMFLAAFVIANLGWPFIVCGYGLAV